MKIEAEFDKKEGKVLQSCPVGGGFYSINNSSREEVEKLNFVLVVVPDGPGLGVMARDPTYRMWIPFLGQRRRYEGSPMYHPHDYAYYDVLLSRPQYRISAKCASK